MALLDANYQTVDITVNAIGSWFRKKKIVEEIWLNRSQHRLINSLSCTQAIGAYVVCVCVCLHVSKCDKYFFPFSFVLLLIGNDMKFRREKKNETNAHTHTHKPTKDRATTRSLSSVSFIRYVHQVESRCLGTLRFVSVVEETKQQHYKNAPNMKRNSQTKYHTKTTTTTSTRAK